MTELKSRIHDKSNGLDYVLVGDYYVPDLKLPEEHRPIGMWGRLHRTYLEQYRPTRFSALCLSGELHGRYSGTVTACPYQRRRCFFKRFITADVKTIWSVFGFLPVRLQKLQGECWSDGYCQNNRV